MSEAASNSKSRPVNVGAQRVATIYAKAFLGAAEAAGNADALVDELGALVRDVLDEFPKLQEVFSSALVTHEEKAALLDRLFATRLSPLLLIFLKVVSRHGRLEVVPTIYQEVQKLYDQLRGRVRVELRTAGQLHDGLAKKLTAELRGMLGREPVVEGVVDPELIGGLVLRVGDTVYDGSLAWQLKQVGEQMITRSVHEIQSRRDSFRHSGGN